MTSHDAGRGAVGGAPASPRVALVETVDVLPGLLPFQAWDALGTADAVFVRDVATHPAATSLFYAGLDLTTLEPATLERGDLDLTRPGAAGDRRTAKALMQHALASGAAVYLLGPGDEGVAPALAGMAAEHDLEIELVFMAQLPQGTELLRAVDVVRRLRDPEDGCPWDLEQDHDSLLRHLVEEAYELVDAVERGDDADMREELGDVLLQVLLHARVAADRSAFGIDDVAGDLAEKLVRRHPHVFGDVDAATAAEVRRNWDVLKDEEKQRDGVFDGVAEAAPGLALLGELQAKAAKRGHTWQGSPESVPLRDAVRDHLASFEPERRQAALGEVLAAVTGVAREFELDPEAAARRSGRGFRRRFEAAYAAVVARGHDPRELDPAAWNDEIAETEDADD